MMPQMPKVDLGRPATYDDLIAVPDVLVAEIVDGELWTSPRPAPRHATVHTELVTAVNAALGGRRGPGCWRILIEPELHLEAQVLVPDIAGWRRERLPALPATAYFTLPPDWVCEVLSPSTAALDRVKKLRIYAEHGVAHAWLVDPIVRTVEILRLHEGRWILLDTHAGRATVRAEPFETFELELELLWPEDGPGISEPTG
jgi:Uma2 family endonuclease